MQSIKKINNTLQNQSQSSKQKIIKSKSISLQKKTSGSSLLEAGIRNNNLTLKQHLLHVGDFCNLTITALGPKNIGIDEFSYGYSILIPNAKLGETVKVQIIKIHLKKAKYAVAKIISVLQQSKAPLAVFEDQRDGKQNLKVGDILTVKLNKIAVQTNSLSIGIVNSDLKFPIKYQLILPVNNQTKIGQEIQIQVTKIKLNYGFAKVLSSNAKLILNNLKYSLSVLRDHSGASDATSKRKTEPYNSLKVGIRIPEINKSKGVGNWALPTKTKRLSNVNYTKNLLNPLDLSGYPNNSIQNNGTNFNNLAKLRYSLSAQQSLAFDKKNKEGVPFAAKKKKIHSILNLANMTKGSKITLILPKTVKKYAKYLVIRHHSGHIFFIKNFLGAKMGDKVRVKFTKTGSSFAIGHIIRISPNSSLTKLAFVRKNLNEMLVNGMHYGEKVVKCQALMRNFLWNRKKISLLASNSANVTKKEQSLFLNLKLNKGVALIKKGRHLINLLKTRRCLNIGLNQLAKYAAKGRTFLFVGTKKPAAGLIARAALFSKTSFFVNTRWLGGMLTNWKTIIKSISTIRPILKEKQKVISNILQKRSKIQNRLIKKVLSLRKKSKILIKKGKQLISKVKMSGHPNSNLGQKNSQIQIKRKELFERGQVLLQKRQNLLNKQNELKEKTLNIKESGFLITSKYKNLLNQLKTTHTKLHDLRLLFLLNKELRKIQKLAKEQGKNQFSISYGKFKQLTTLASSLSEKKGKSNIALETGSVNTGFIHSKKFWLIPNPPQEILNKLIIKINEISNQEWLSNSVARSHKVLNNSKKAKTSFLNMQIGSYKTNSSVKEKNTTGILLLQDSSLANQGQLIILTKLLSKFSRFLPYIKNSINVLLGIMRNIENKISELKKNLKYLKTTLTDYLLLNNKINIELELIKTKYLSEQQIIRVLRRKLKRHEAEKKLLQFLPKLRYLPTPKSQISFAIQLLMKRFVDPKMKYPLDLIYDEKLRKKSKKVATARKKKWQRLETYFGGIANMTKLKKTQISKNVAIIIGQQEEINAIRECKKLGIKMFHIVDTNCNPSLADHFIPANDDSRNSIKYLLAKMVTRIRLAQKISLRFNNKKGIGVRSF